MSCNICTVNVDDDWHACRRCSTYKLDADHNCRGCHKTETECEDACKNAIYMAGNNDMITPTARVTRKKNNDTYLAVHEEGKVARQ